jgi:SP family general alpha glucoside:H+ symporter-like MFS transporter
MTAQRIAPSDQEVEEIQRAGAQADLIRQAQESDEADRKLTIRQAVGKYKKAVLWAMFLSTSLIMEGYDLVIVWDPIFTQNPCWSTTHHRRL